MAYGQEFNGIMWPFYCATRNLDFVDQIELISRFKADRAPKPRGKAWDRLLRIQNEAFMKRALNGEWKVNVKGIDPQGLRLENLGIHHD